MSICPRIHLSNGCEGWHHARPMREKRDTIAILVLLCAATIAAFWPLARNGFVFYDDPDYVSRNAMVQQGLTWAGLKWSFTTFFASNWHPLTWLSHMLDCQLFGLQAGAHHLVSLFIHVVNAALLFLLLKRMTGAQWRSAIVAALFALHPVHVESVAWTSERKDVLSALFLFLTLLAYVSYAKQFGVWSLKFRVSQTGGVHQERSKFSVQGSGFNVIFWYVIVFLCFALGLMTKPMLVTAPFVMLLLDYWPLRRVAQFGVSSLKFKASDVSEPIKATHHFSRFTLYDLHLVAEKLPFFALSTVSSVLTFVAQKRGGAVAPLEHLPFASRLSNALMAYVCYLKKTIWPDNLAVLDLRPETWPVWQLGLAALVLIAITGFVFLRKEPWLIVGWLWYLGMLVPVIGLVQVGNQFMADRYTYLPLIGCFIMLVWSLAEYFGPALEDFSRRTATVSIAALALMVIGFGVATSRQATFWRDTETLFDHCLAVTSGNYIAHNILGAALASQGRFKDAKHHFLEALRIQPTHADTLRNFGIMLTDAGEFDEARRYLSDAVRVNPRNADVYASLGLVLDSKGSTEQAIAYYRECLRLLPAQVDACNNLAWILATRPESKFRDGAEAVRLAERACEATGYKEPMLIGTLAAAYAEAGRTSDAVSSADKAISLAETVGQQGVAERNRQLIEVYRSGKPYHEPSPGTK